VSLDPTTAFNKGLFLLIYVSKNHVHDVFEYIAKKPALGISSMFYKTDFTLPNFSIRFHNIDQDSATLLRASFPDLLC